jgi:hypothetical protein
MNWRDLTLEERFEVLFMKTNHLEYIKSCSIDNLAMDIENQANVLFPRRTDTSMFLKLFSEVGELAENLSEDELADVLIMLLDFGSRKKFNIEAAIRRKMAVNATRKWEANELGVMKHVP